MNKAQLKAKKKRRLERSNSSYDPRAVMRWSMFTPEEQRMISEAIEAPYRNNSAEN